MPACCTGTARKCSTGTARLPRPEVGDSVGPRPKSIKNAIFPGGKHMRSKTILRAVLGASLAVALLSPALAADNEIRLAQQFSMGYLQLNVMQHEKLIEKQAKALGIPDAKVSWFKFNGPTAVNEALISGNVDIGSGGVPGLLTLWARTKGTPQEVRGISALSSQPFLLNAKNPAIKT